MEPRLDIYNKDVLNWSRWYDGEPFHALFTDCPYEYGFLDKSWDSSGISFSPETWAALGDHLLPGAYGMTYGGARTWHRIAVAIEDAGFIIHPSIFCWVYATGLHKGKRVDYVIDKENDVFDKREVLEKSVSTYGYQKSGERWIKDHYVTSPYSQEAIEWQEHRYGMQSLRPAVEPVILFQKPYEAGKKTDTIREYGTGSFYIEACKYNGGKWPTNFVVAHHPLCTQLKCHHLCNVAGGNFDTSYFPSFRWDADIMEGASVYYGKKSLGKERKIALEGINHPTVKPLSVNIWFSRLLLPPATYSPRRLLVPFGGVMSEAIASIFAGWEYVLGIEKEKPYAKAGIKRAQWWIDMARKYGYDVDAVLEASETDDGTAKQLSLQL